MTPRADRRSRLAREVDEVFASRSPALFAFFGFIFGRALKRDFRAVRFAKAAVPPPAGTPHLIVYSNHPSWWDAVIFVWLGATLFRRQRIFAPIERAMIERYGFMRRIGAFGIERGTRDGATLFLAASSRILADPDNVLLINAQGRFVDVRQRPLDLAPGVAHLAAATPHATFMPLAIDYAFWDERKPEAFLRFGTAIPAATLADLPRPMVLDRLTAALESTMDDLARDVAARDARRFDTVLSGSVGVGGIYDLWRRLRAVVTGTRFLPMHGDGR